MSITAEQLTEILKNQETNFLKAQEEMLKRICKQSSNPPASMQLYIASYENFNEKSESFKHYKQRFENYASRKGLHINNDQEQYAKLLLDSIGAKYFTLVSDLAAPNEPEKLKYEELIKLLETHLAPKRNELVAQHQFLSKYQNENQSISEYIAALRSELIDCNFVSPCNCQTSIADILLRAQLIRGIRDNHVREQLLQSKEMTFDAISKLAITLEASKSDSQQISSENSTSKTENVHKVRSEHFSRSKSKPNHRPDVTTDNRRLSRSRYQNESNNTRSRSKSKPRINYKELGIDGLCLRCGKNNHRVQDCRCDSSRLKCDHCKRTGHVARVCITSLIQNKKKQAEVKTVQPNEYGINKIEEVYQANPNNEDDRYFINVQIQNQPIMVEVDSGSKYTLLPRKQFQELNLNIPLQPASVTFKAYTQDIFKPDGKVIVNASYNGKKIRDEIYIVPDEYSPVLGRNWIRKLKISLEEIDQRYAINYSPETMNNIDANDIYSEYKDVFEGKIGCVPDYEIHHQLREGAKPVYHRERMLPHSLIELVEKELKTLEETGIITKTTSSDWGSPLVVILKKDGGVRLCVDYKIGVNKRLKDVRYPIKKIDEILNKLRNAKYFCRLDLFKAYLHIKVDDKSSEIQTITTHLGMFKVNRLSFGIKTAPAEFNRIIDQILSTIPNAISYFDDIVVWGATLEECRQNLIKCLNQLRKYNLHLNANKCILFAKSIEYLGHIIEYNKIRKSPAKIAAITQIPIPCNDVEVRRFIGMITHYARFIPNHSTLTAPLRKLINKNTPFIWDNDCQIAFELLKNEISSDRVLVPFNPALPIRLTCDASPYGVAGILSHVINDQEQPIAYGSRSLTSAEKNYSQLDREALSIMFSVQHFFQYLFGIKFQLVSDNRPLTRIFHQDASIPEMTSARLQRYAAFLSGFNYEIIHKKGCENIHVDCLSRAPIPLSSNSIPDSVGNEVHEILITAVNQITSNILTYANIKHETQKDDELQKTIKELQSSDISDSLFTIDDNVLYRNQRVVIPKILQKTALQELHHTHVGVTKMKQLARKYIYWKNIDNDIEQLVRECDNCAKIQKSPTKAPLHHWDEPVNNWQRIHIDYAGPYQGHHFLVIVDAKSKWIETSYQKDAPTSQSTIEILNNVFARNGLPEILVSDNASIFTSDVFKSYCKNKGIFQNFTAPGNPSTNGLAERNIQTLKRRLACMENENKPMHTKLQEILMRYRATPLKNGKTPAELYLHRQIRIKLDTIFPTNIQPTTKPIIVKGTRQFQEGDRVQARYYANNKSQWQPGIVEKKFGNLHYLIHLDNGYIFKRHIDQLRKGSKSVKFEIQPEIMTPNRQKVEEENILSAPPMGMTVPAPNRNENVRRGRGRPPPVEIRDAEARNRRTPRYLSDYIT